MKRYLTLAALLPLCWLTLSLSAAEARFVSNLKAGQAQTVVCYGTSLTAISHEWVDGLRAELNVRWPGLATVVNAGLSGKNSAVGLANVETQVCAKKPDAVLIEFSMNDAADSLNAGKTAEEAIAAAEANLKAIVAAIKSANPSCEIILETMDPYLAVAGSNLSNRTALDRHVAMYRRVAAENGYGLIDSYPIWSRILAKGADEYRKLVPDGVHPNALGSQTVTLPNVMRTLGLDLVEPAREIPVIKDVDVLVVGGTFAGVSAAVAAKEAGSSVFLVAPRRNLAEEIVLPRRLVRPADDEPLDDLAVSTVTQAAETQAFSYTTTATVNSAKPDNSYTKLTDGQRGSAASQSVQYDDATVTWNLTTAGGEKAVKSVVLYSYYRPSGGDFNVASLAVETSQDGETFVTAEGTTTKSVAQTGLEYGDECHALTVALATPTTARHLRITATRAAGAKRMLIGELELQVDGKTVTVPLAPLVYERTLDKRLEAAGVDFFTGAQACDVIRADDGAVAGVVFADKSGRQAVRAKVVIDATDKGVVARRVAMLRPIAPETSVAFTQTIIAKAGLDLQPEGYDVVEYAATSPSVTLNVGGDTSMIPKDAETSYAASSYAFTKRFPLAGGDWLAVNAIAHEMKTATWTKSAADVAEVPFYVTPERIVGAAQVTDWPAEGAAAVDLGAFTPLGVQGLYVVGQLADVAREMAEKLSWPGVETVLGRRVGELSSRVAQQSSRVAQQSSRVASTRGALQADRASATARGEPGTLLDSATARGEPGTPYTVHERLERPLGIGSDQSGGYLSAPASLPVLATADIAVLGLGTAGAPAAIGAISKGKTVVAIDFLNTAGGVMTEGRIGKYYKGFNRGFSKNVVDVGTLNTGWIFSMAKAEWMRRSVAGSGLGTVIFGSQVEGVVTEGTDAKGRKVVTGLVVVLPDGTRGVVKASVVLDCSGNAEIAQIAGCPTQFLEAREFSMQGSGTTYHVLGNSYFNTDFGFLNTSDAGDLSNFARRARAGAGSGRFNVGDPSVSSRERRRIVGDIVVNERDILRRRKWSDTIMHGKSDYDMHGFSVSDTLMYRERPHGTEFQAELPYRALLPADLANVLATGLGISATRDAMPIIRMQRDVQNQGHAAGLAAAMALTAGSVRTIDIRALQQELVNIGSLDANVLKDTDDTVSDTALASAVGNLSTALFTGLEKIVERPDDAKPLLEAELTGSGGVLAPDALSSDPHALACAIALILVGDNTYLDQVIAATEAADWSKGFNFRGLGNYGRQTAPVDYLIHALVKSGEAERVVPVLLKLIEKLNGDTHLSHVRMLANAADDLKSAELRTALAAAVEAQPKLTGYSVTTTETIAAQDVAGGDNRPNDVERTKCLIELALARALHNAGDARGTAILTAYLDDARTIYATWAKLALASAEKPTPQPPKPIVTERIAVTNGTLSVTSAALTMGAAAAKVTDGGFEPRVDKLPTGDTAQQDKRSVSGADWLKRNLPDWTFGPDDNNGSGVANNGSYFTNNGQLNKLYEGNTTCAFLRIDLSKSPAVGPGRISRTFVAPVAKASYTFSCRLAQRYWNSTWTGKVALEVDGTVIATSELVNSWSLWPEFKVEFTVETAGTHTLALVAVANDEGSCDVIVDEVTLGFTYARELTAEAPLAGVTLDLAKAAKLDLDATLAGTIGGVRYDGQRILGEISAMTHPEFVTGEGVLKAYGRFVVSVW